MDTETAEVIRDLMRELWYAYHGTHTLPAEHDARKAYERATELLGRSTGNGVAAALTDALAAKVETALNKAGLRKE